VIGLVGIVLWLLLPLNIMSATFWTRLLMSCALMSVWILTNFWVFRTLAAHDTGPAFTPVKGLAREGAFRYSRNPLYVVLLICVLPTLGLLINSWWPILLTPGLFVYLHVWVIPAEE
ncbi:unnamed protein product, partial [Effrenium voratum]